MNSPLFGSPGEASRLSCRMRMLTLVMFVTLFVTVCWGVGTIIVGVE
ncbi:MAG: hypothetical protein KAF42_00345 [Sphingopyxis terrae]|jgi:hypothetical protein|nr:hypothetical protein [Sphingopyxis terrae]MBU7587641.1 hypothetical protein [Sphingopyxis terrae]